MFLPARRASDVVRFRNAPQKFFEFVSTIVARVFEYRHDFRVARTAENVHKIDRALREFGFAATLLSPDLFLTPNNIVRIGVPPLRIEILTSI